MQIDIKTADITPIRKTYKHVAKRIGEDKIASRYQEATLGLQSETNFHYRPYWDSQFELYDENRTQIKMKDWYDFKDPRQFYYGTWTIARAKQQDSIENNYSFVERHALLTNLDDDAKALVASLIVPLRHLEYAANLNDYFITAYGYGTAITQMTSFSGMDRLASAQYLSRIGLMLGENDTEILAQAKLDWLEQPQWQPLRQLAEDLFIVDDWFELLVAQHMVLDSFIYPFAYQHLENFLGQNNGAPVSLLTAFMNEWFTESKRWVDAIIKTAAKESTENLQKLQAWTEKWHPRVVEAVAPLVQSAFGEECQHVIGSIDDEFKARITKKCSLSTF